MPNQFHDVAKQSLRPVAKRSQRLSRGVVFLTTGLSTCLFTDGAGGFFSVVMPNIEQRRREQSFPVSGG